LWCEQFGSVFVNVVLVTPPVQSCPSHEEE